MITLVQRLIGWFWRTVTREATPDDKKHVDEDWGSQETDIEVKTSREISLRGHFGLKGIDIQTTLRNPSNADRRFVIFMLFGIALLVIGYALLMS